MKRCFRPGERVLVHGGAGGVGSAALELAAVLKLDAYATASCTGCTVVADLGATAIDNRRDTRKVAVCYATGALAFAANLLPGRRVLAYQSAKTRDRHPDWYRTDLAELFRLLSDGHLHPPIAARLPLTQARHAHELLAHGGVPGKLVLIP